jgi:hypothetical protein
MKLMVVIISCFVIFSSAVHGMDKAQSRKKTKSSKKIDKKLNKSDSTKKVPDLEFAPGSPTGKTRQTGSLSSGGTPKTPTVKSLGELQTRIAANKTSILKTSTTEDSSTK